MLTVVTPAVSRRLTTVANVRADLGLAEDAPTDGQLNRFIDQASAAAERYCRRTFARETVRQTFPGCDLRRDALLARGPVAAISAVTWNGGVVDPAGYELDAGILYRLGASGRFAWWGSSLAVQYDAGFILPGEDGADLPADVERAAILLVGAALSAQSRDPLVKSEDIDGVRAVSYWVPGAKSQLPSPEAETLLRPYRIARVR